MDDVSRAVASLASLTARELAEKYEKLVGSPSRSTNRAFLQRRVAVILQARRDGWLSPSACTKIRQLGGEVWRPAGVARVMRPDHASLARDPRLPSPGSVLLRPHAGRTYAVDVLELGFELDGVRYATLTEVARAITGRKWNGYEFFKVAPGWRHPVADGGARRRFRCRMTACSGKRA